MLFKTRIACYGNRDIALDVAREVIIEAGFEATSGPKDDIQEFVNPRRWNLSSQSSLCLADAISVRSAPDSLVLAGNLDGVPRRTKLLSATICVVGVLLIIANYLWAVHPQPLFKVLLPVAAWPIIIPLIHKNMNWMAQRKWNLTLRAIGRSAALHAAEKTVVEEAQVENEAEVLPVAEVQEHEELQLV